MKEDEGNSGLLRITLDARCFDTQLNKITCRLFAISAWKFLFGLFRCNFSCQVYLQYLFSSPL